ncbi:uncharacterized protein [Pseudorasbora parva]|uniref:uncharacterized protein n=1 Tax=Pseudorasbora parva TaxID=51549 RepID=UPI00351DE759
MVTAGPSDVVQPSGSTVTDQVQQGAKVCHICGLHFSTTSNLKRHEREQHDGQEPMICIDPKNGLYVTTKHSHGVRLPIHLQKCLPARLYDCEVEECRDFMSIAAQSGNPGKECYHLERTRKAHAYIPPPALNNKSVKEMAEKGLISTPRQEECMALYPRASSEEVDCVFPIFWGKHSLSEGYIFFSVNTGEKENWCKFGRTLSTFDTKSGKWHSQCISSRKRISCVHRYLSMWWLFQKHPHLTKNSLDTSNEDIEDLEEMVSGNLGMHYQPEYTHSSVITLTNYFWNSKRIPEDFPLDLTKTENPVPENLQHMQKSMEYFRRTKVGIL